MMHSEYGSSSLESCFLSRSASAPIMVADALQLNTFPVSGRCSSYIGGIAETPTRNITTATSSSTLNVIPISFVADFLHRLTKMLREGNESYIEWSEGKLHIHNPSKLASEVLPKYYRHSKYSSFQRQLNYFGFRKISGKGKMSACVYSNDVTTDDVFSILSLKRKPSFPSIKSTSAIKNKMNKPNITSNAPLLKNKHAFVNSLNRDKVNIQKPAIGNHNFEFPLVIQNNFAQPIDNNCQRNHQFPFGYASNVHTVEKVTSATVKSCNLNMQSDACQQIPQVQVLETHYEKSNMSSSYGNLMSSSFNASTHCEKSNISSSNGNLMSSSFNASMFNKRSSTSPKGHALSVVGKTNNVQDCSMFTGEDNNIEGIMFHMPLPLTPNEQNNHQIFNHNNEFKSRLDAASCAKPQEFTPNNNMPLMINQQQRNLCNNPNVTQNCEMKSLVEATISATPHDLMLNMQAIVNQQNPYNNVLNQSYEMKALAIDGTTTSSAIPQAIDIKLTSQSDLRSMNSVELNQSFNDLDTCMSNSDFTDMLDSLAKDSGDDAQFVGPNLLSKTYFSG